MTPSNPHREYLASRVSAATPMELTRMLFEGAVQSVRDSITAHRAGDILARGNAVTKAVQILGELRFSLRRDVAPQYCDTLSGLYGYLQSRLIQAHAEKSELMLQEVLGLIQTLLDGWIGATRNSTPPETPLPGSTAAQQDAPSAMEPAGASNPYSSPHSSTVGPAPEGLNRSWEF